MTTSTFDVAMVTPEFTEGIPNHHATSGETGDPAPSPGFSEAPTNAGRRNSRRRSLFATSPEEKRRNSSSRPSVPKLPASAKKRIEDFYTLIGGLIKPYDEVIGDSIMESAKDCSEAVFQLAQENESFRRALAGMMTGSLTMALVFAHLPIVLAIVNRVSKSEDVKTKTAMGMFGFKMAKTMSDQMPGSLWEGVENSSDIPE